MHQLDINQKKKEKKLITKILVTLLISIIILILLSSLDLGLLYELSQESEYFYASKTEGLSMYPQIYTGDMFIVMKVTHPDFDVDCGDILVYTNGEYNIGHRVAVVYDGYYLTKGDNNQGFEQVYETQVLGKVVKIINRYNPIGQWVTARVSR